MSDRKIFKMEIPEGISVEEVKSVIKKMFENKVLVSPIEQNPDRINITCILDRSGSMSTIIEDSIGGFNTFLKEQQENKDGEAWLSIQLFDDRHEELEPLRPINEIAPLHNKNYVPRGMTALYDAIGRTITKLKASGTKNNIVVILTDGYENSSREFNSEQIKKLITECEADGWKFIYLGANQDAFAVSHSLGIKGGATFNFAATAAGTLDAYSNMTRSTASYRSDYVNKKDSNLKDSQ